MTNVGLMAYFLGIEVEQTDNDSFISQKKYAKGILKPCWSEVEDFKIWKRSHD